MREIETDKFYSLAETANLLTLTVTTLKNGIKAGKLAAQKVKHHVYPKWRYVISGKDILSYKNERQKS